MHGSDGRQDPEGLGKTEPLEVLALGSPASGMARKCWCNPNEM